MTHPLSLTKKVAAGQAVTGGKTKNFFSRVFLPYETMAQIYPALRKHPRRLPYYELYRWCRLLFRGSARSVWAELRENQKVKAEEIRTAESLLKDLELL